MVQTTERLSFARKLYYHKHCEASIRQSLLSAVYSYSMNRRSMVGKKKAQADEAAGEELRMGARATTCAETSPASRSRRRQLSP